MKNFLTLLLFLGVISSGQSQEIVRLDELKVKGTAPFSLKVNPYTNAVEYRVVESYSGEFRKNPLEFVQKHFDAQKFIKDNDVTRGDYFDLSFSSKSGRIRATFDARGKMVSSYQEMRDVPLGHASLLELAKKYQDWGLVDNKAIEITKNGKLVRQYQRVKINNGRKNKIVKFHSDLQKGRIASIKQ